MHLRDKLSLHEIAKRTGLSRNTLRKWLRKPEGGGGAARTARQQAPSKLTRLSRDAGAGPQGRCPSHQAEPAHGQGAVRADQGRRLRRRLQPRHRFHPRLARAAKARRHMPSCRCSFELGEAFQFDWSEEGLVVGGIYRRMQVAHLKLCASRAFWLVAYPSQGHEMLFDAHTRSFAALGGVPRRGIYDNMKTAVDKVNKGKGRIVNARFAAMCAHYLFDPDFCNVASRLGERRGREERAGQPPAHLDRGADAAVRLVRRTQRLAGRALPGAVERTAPPGVPGS